MDRTQDPKLILAETDRMRELARRLLRDDDLSHDVAQETWLAALTTPSDKIRDLSGWLSGVTRNLARKASRSRKRNTRRESDASSPAAPPTPQEILARESARREVISALLRLPELYRVPLILRYFEDLEPREIAVRLKLPPATARTRIKRGLDQLRGEMRRENPRYRTGLLLLAALGTINASNAHATVTGAGESGLKIGTSTGIVGATLAMATLITMIFFAAYRDNSRPEHQNSVQITRQDPERLPTTIDLPRLGESLHDPPPHEPTTDSRRVLRSEILSIDRRPGRLYGQVLDGLSKNPVSGATIRVHPTPGRLPRGFEYKEDRERREHRTTTDTEGRFSFVGIPHGPYSLTVVDVGGETTTELAAASPDGLFLQIWHRAKPRFTAPAKDVPVLVLDRDDNPVVGALVTLGRGSKSSPNRPAVLKATTDDEGNALFADCQFDRGVLLAVGPTGDMARKTFSRGDAVTRSFETLVSESRRLQRTIVMRLEAPGAIEGALVHGDGLTVIAWLGSSTPDALNRSATVGPEGAFRLDGLAPGTYTLTVSCPPLQRLRHQFKDAFPRPGLRLYRTIDVEVRSGEASTAFLEMTEGPLLTGRVVGEDGSPVEGAFVTVTLPQGLVGNENRVRRGGVHFWRLDDESCQNLRHPIRIKTQRTDRSGHYRFTGLLPAPDYRVEVKVPGLSYDRMEDVVLLDGEERTLKHTLVPSGGIQGVARSWASLGIRRANENPVLISFLAPRRPLAPFTIPGIRPGRYELVDLHSDPERAPVLLATVLVRAGELTWIDLTDRAEVRAEGSFVHLGKPVQGAILSFFGPQVRTDSSGRFVYAHARTSDGTRQFDLLLPTLENSVPLRLAFPGMLSGRWVREIHLPESELEITVVDDLGSPLAAEVKLVPVATEIKMQYRRGLFELNAPDQGLIEAKGITRTTDDHGRVRFAVLPADRYRVTARMVNRPQTFITPVELDLPESSKKHIVLRPLPGTPVEISVLDERGRPEVDRPVAIELETVGASLHLDLGRTDFEGKVRLSNAPAGWARAHLNSSWSLLASQGEIEFSIEEGAVSRATIISHPHPARRKR